MDTTDVCDLDEFKNDPECMKRRKRCGIGEDIFWALVMVAVAFFSRIWFMIVDRILTNLFGIQKDDYELAFLGLVSLVAVITLSQCFEVNLKMD